MLAKAEKRGWPNRILSGRMGFGFHVDIQPTVQEFACQFDFVVFCGEVQQCRPLERKQSVGQGEGAVKGFRIFVQRLLEGGQVAFVDRHDRVIRGFGTRFEQNADATVFVGGPDMT